MASISEVGHAKNASNFQNLIEFVTSYQNAYNPSKNTLKIPQLNALKAAADNALADVIVKNTSYANTLNQRSIAFEGLRTLATRLINALQISGAPKETINNAKTFNRKIQGKKAPSTPKTADPNTPAPKTISSSQQSFDQRIQHLAALIAVLEAEQAYSPNETELQTASLKTKIADLNTKNNAVAAAYAALSNARIARNQILYSTGTGLVDTAKEVKTYIKAAFGAASPQFAQVNGVSFRTNKI